MNEFKKNIYRQSDEVVITPPSYYSYSFSYPGDVSSTDSCLQTTFTVLFYSSSSSLSIGTQMYTNTALTSPVLYGNYWYKYQVDNFSYRINSSGQIAEIVDCSITYNYRFEDCTTGLSYNSVKGATYFIIGDTIEYITIANPHMIRCGTISSVTFPTGVEDSTLTGIQRDCGDPTHCDKAI